jgi:hypothetical protein
MAQITGPLVEGATTISGSAPGGSTLRLCDLNAQTLLGVTSSPTTAAANTGAFKATLQAPLVSGQSIELQEKTTDTAPGGATDTDAAKAVSCSATDGWKAYPAVVVVGIADWGRVRATFAAGTVLSSDSGFQGKSSTQSTLFMDLNVEKNWRWAGVTRCVVGNSCPSGLQWDHRVLFNTFFEARLTSIPEAQQATPPAASTPAAAGGGGTTGGASSTSTDTLSTFIGSRKSATLQAGAYFPFLVNKWTWNNAPNSLFIAPLAKIGFITPTSSSTSETPSGTAAQPVNPQQFYNYYGWGGRIGHYKLSYDKNEAPELLSYIDVIFGRFSNLEALAPVLTSSGNPVVVNGTPLSYPRRRYRIGIEGTLKIPSTRFSSGSAPISDRISRFSTNCWPQRTTCDFSSARSSTSANSSGSCSSSDRFGRRGFIAPDVRRET